MMKGILTGVLVALGSAAGAQSMSVADIMGQVDKEIAALDEYAALLNDPDPRRARKAMEIMLGSGDAELEQLALDFGLYSADPVVRRAALDAFLRTKPSLELRLDGKDSDMNSFRRGIESWGGTINADGTGLLLLWVGDWKDEWNCYLAYGRDECLLRVTDDSVSLRTYEKWGAFSLGADGIMRGSAYVDNLGAVPTEIPVLR